MITDPGVATSRTTAADRRSHVFFWSSESCVRPARYWSAGVMATVSGIARLLAVAVGVAAFAVAGLREIRELVGEPASAFAHAFRRECVPEQVAADPPYQSDSHQPREARFQFNER